MPHTRFSYLSDIEFERELEHRARSGQLVLGAELTKEMMERVRKWVETAEREEDYPDLEDREY